jgi:hypothetical protein
MFARVAGDCRNAARMAGTFSIGTCRKPAWSL